MVSWALPQHCWDVIVQPRGGAEILVSAVGATLLPVPSVTYTGNFKKMARRTLGRTSNLGTLDRILREQSLSCHCCLVPRQITSTCYWSFGPKLPGQYGWGTSSVEWMSLAVGDHLPDQGVFPAM